MMKLLGLSGLPVAQAGHSAWQRPHSVQVKPSRRSFQPRSVRVRTPNRSAVSSSSIGSRPRGPSFRRVTLKKLVAM